MARKPLNRKALRAEAEAAEKIKKKKAEEVVEEEEDDDDDSDDDEDGDDDDELDDDAFEESDEEDPDAVAESEDEEGVRPKKKKKAKVAKVAKVKKPRVTKAGKGKKSARMRAIWVVLSNNATKVASYEFSKEKEARDHAERLMTEKKQVHFVQMVKEEMTEPAWFIWRNK